MRRAVFLDRDGVINRTYVKDGVAYPPSSVHDFELLPGAEAACRRLRSAGFLLIVVTNQPDVARGKTTRAVVEQLNEIVKNYVLIDHIMTCFHDDADCCVCRKPKPGMLLEAAAVFSIDLPRSYMIGDRWKDVAAGREAGCSTILIISQCADDQIVEPDHRADSLLSAADWIIKQAVTV